MESLERQKDKIFGTSFSSIPLSATMEATGIESESEYRNVGKIPSMPVRDWKMKNDSDENKPILHFYELYDQRRIQWKKIFSQLKFLPSISYLLLSLGCF